MTAPTRRQIMAGSLSAVGVAGAPAIAIAVDPEERLRNALLELEAAAQARWPNGKVRVFELDTAHAVQSPGFQLFVWRAPQ